MAKNITLLLDAGHLRWALRAALAAASKDYVTPVLCAVRVVVEGKHIHFIATDRYRVHETIVPRPKGATAGSFLMDRAQAQWILTNSHKPARSFPEQQVRITWVEGAPATAGRISVEVSASAEPEAPVFRYDADAVRGNYPPVHGIFGKLEKDGDSVEVVGLNPDFIATLRHLTGYRGEALVFTMSKAREKAGPILVENAAGTARALIQPNLLLSKAEWQGGELEVPAPVVKAAAA